MVVVVVVVVVVGRQRERAQLDGEWQHRTAAQFEQAMVEDGAAICLQVIAKDQTMARY